MERLPPIAFRPTLPELLHRAADRFGENDYVVMANRRISFAGAERASAALARRLLAAGVGKGTRVGILLPSGIDWVLAWLAVGRIGALAMLFPSTYRAAEVRRVLRISDATLLIASTTMLSKDQLPLLEEAVPSLAGHGDAPIHDEEVPYLRSIWLTGAELPAWATPFEDAVARPTVSKGLLAAVESEVAPADDLLVIYTSGSTAEPKAVVHTHGATIRKVQAELGVCLPGSLPGRTFCAMPFFWVGGPQDLLGALHSGAAVITQERFDAGGALDLLEREQCTSIMGWATVLEQIRSVPGFADRAVRAFDAPLGGPAVAPPPMFSSRGHPRNIGMTETFGPHANREWFDYKVVDPETGDPLPDGEIGEFCVRGFGVMAGLYKKEREEVFDTEGYYHTGDRGYLENTHIWFAGRYGDMIKARGANVSPLEVEQVLESFSDITSAFVFGVREPDGNDAIAGAVLPADGLRIDIDDLRRRLEHELSSYKVPRHLYVLDEDEIPRLPSGKPDKRTLARRVESSLRGADG